MRQQASQHEHRHSRRGAPAWSDEAGQRMERVPEEVRLSGCGKDLPGAQPQFQEKHHVRSSLKPIGHGPSDEHLLHCRAPARAI